MDKESITAHAQYNEKKEKDSLKKPKIVVNRSFFG